MKILLITWYFPPLNDVAAVRTGALAGYLRERGHDVHVLTAARTGEATLPVPLAPDRIVRTAWFDIDQLRVKSYPDSNAPSVSARPTTLPEPKKRFARLRAAATNAYANLAHIPDRQIGWFSYARDAGLKLAASHGFDLIYASGPPFTTHLIARSLSRKLGVHWIAEYRDGWSRYLYVPRPAWRQAIDERLESATVGTAAAIVAVTEPWAVYYRERYKIPATAIYNGLDARTVTTVENEPARDAPVSISYLGVLYDGLRDPSALYDAIRRSELAPGDVQLVYYGPSETEVRPLADRLGVNAYISVRPRVSYAQSLVIQSSSDVLLLLQAPDDPRNVPAKLFEYLASERPILGLGLDNGIPATLIRERQAGFYVTDPVSIADQLHKWVGEKRRTGRIAAIPPEARAGLSRSEQFDALERFLIAVRAGTAKNV